MTKELTKQKADMIRLLFSQFLQPWEDISDYFRHDINKLFDALTHNQTLDVDLTVNDLDMFMVITELTQIQLKYEIRR